MIENYFTTGVRIKWIPPKEATRAADGSVVDTPAIPTNPMIYDGRDNELFDIVHVSTPGAVKGMQIPYRWLAYAPGRTTRCPLAGLDILTGPMSGCLIARWVDGGTQYVGHIGTEGSNQALNRTVKRGFAAEAYSQLTAFDPASKRVWSEGEIRRKMSAFKVAPGMNFYALVTSAGVFYSILLFSLQHAGAKKVGPTYIGFERCIGGIKRVQPMNSVAVRAKLMW